MVYQTVVIETSYILSSSMGRPVGVVPKCNIWAVLARVGYRLALNPTVGTPLRMFGVDISRLNELPHDSN